MGSLKNWMLSFLAGPYPGIALFCFAFAESSFFPIPPDIMLIPLVLARPEHWLLYAVITTVASVLGGMAGYLIGSYGGRPVLLKFFASPKVDLVQHYYDKYNAWATAIAGLTPLPYKIFTIGAGTFKVNFHVFVLASIGSRGLRFFAVAGLTRLFGHQVMPIIKDYFNVATIMFILLLVGGFWAVGYLAKRIQRSKS